NEFNHVVDAIIQARKIFIIGFRTSSLLSRYFGYYLNIISDQVIIIDHDGGDVYENLIKISPDDVIIGISFPRYSHKTNEILSYVQKKGGKIIAVTDNQKAPIVKHADHALIAKSNIITFVDTLVAPLSLLNALIVAIGYKRKDQTWETFKELEELWCEHDVYTGAKKYEEE
ncbi:MAG TPA: N-acetylmannosamine kinase, partial [Eubacteriaceae bacterium]|nr:N-acetylmannosamine kinase [Eubacteriaceae bacterium]